MKTREVRRATFMLLLCPLAALVVGAACAESGQESSAVVESSRRIVGDTVLVANRVPTTVDTARLEEVIRIGRVDGPPEYQLFEVRALAVGRDGDLYVAQADGELRQYKSDGSFVRTVARPGEGPGEVRFVTGMAVLRDGRLVARDEGNRRINVYDTDGQVLDHWPLPDGRLAYGRRSVVAESVGTVVVALSLRLPSDGSPLRWPRAVGLRLAGDGSVRDTLFAPARFLDRCPTRSRRAFQSGFIEDFRVRYLPKVTWTFGSGGEFAVGCPATYELEILRPGRPILRIRRDWQPVSVSDEERKSFKTALTYQMNESGSFKSWSWTGPDLPDQKPAYQKILLADDGRIWVWVSEPGVPEQVAAAAVRAGLPRRYWRDRPGGTFDVFDADGRYLAPVRLPDNARVSPIAPYPDPVFFGDTLWALTVDENDVEYVSGFRVSFPPSR